MLTERLRFRDIRRTSTFRLTVMLSAVFTVGMVALLGLIYGITARELTARSDRILRQEAARLVTLPPDQLPARITEEVARNRQGLNYLALISSDGEQVVGNIRTDGALSHDRPVDIEGSGTRPPFRLISIRTHAGETILLGRDISQIRDLRQRIFVIIIVTGVTMTISTLLAAIALSIRPLRRVRDFQEASQAISAGRFDGRMPLTSGHDELDQFAATVNVMVVELGRVIAQVKGITDAVAHDLRTPLTRVRTHINRARQLTDASPAFAALAEKAVADLDVVLDRFTALLRISEIEAGGRRSGFASVDLSLLAQSVIDLYEPLAEDKCVAIRMDGCAPVMVEADGKLLFEALSNLVDNAIKFATTSVRLAVRHDSEAVVVEVRDDGPGIPPEERDAVLRRFHRGAHTADVPGSGLGLSVVAAIMHLHGFALRLDGQGSGLVAQIRIEN